MKIDEIIVQIEFLNEAAREEGRKEVLVEANSWVEAAIEFGREEIKNLFDPLIVEYNAKVLLHRDLTFLGESYFESLAKA